MRRWGLGHLVPLQERLSTRNVPHVYRDGNGDRLSRPGGALQGEAPIFDACMACAVCAPAMQARRARPDPRGRDSLLPLLTGRHSAGTLS